MSELPQKIILAVLTLLGTALFVAACFLLAQPGTASAFFAMVPLNPCRARRGCQGAATAASSWTGRHFR